VAGTLTVRIHYPANPLLGRAVARLCEELTAKETVFPTTHLRLVYQLADDAPAGEARVQGAAAVPETSSPHDQPNPITP
jgi:hypothetical protein